MSKISSVERNKNRKKLVDKFAARRAALKKTVNDRELSLEQRFAAQLKLSSLPRNSAKIRLRNRCRLTGRARGFYRKFNLSRSILRDMSANALIPGMTKASW